jgi:2-C-methyl-D-erythritol 2,4-cyclodiphosphate synthase/2-C-methyl-D-erythritol 4-phosphate cytidylyltransferase
VTRAQAGRWLILAAAGSGARSGEPLNKAFAPLGDSCAALLCLKAFAPFVDGAVVAIGSEDVPSWEAVERRAQVLTSVITVRGGLNRQASVSRALSHVPPDARLVAVHDAARPFVSAAVIERCFAQAERTGAAIPVVPVADTMLIVGESGSEEAPPRDLLRAVQTPQVFRRDWLARAYEDASDGAATDDATLVRAAGHAVSIVDGETRNRKLTTPEDFRIARMEIMLNERETQSAANQPRVGFGLDAHRLSPDRPLVLCGVTVPHTAGLLGHSDADVAVHALIDALLGAAALGDIGRWFPDSDAAYKGISSMLLLKRVVDGLAERGYRVGNADVTIVAQRPKLAGFIPAMRDSLAGVLGVDVGDVSVKATTTERMGYEGREEGVSAHAAAVLYRKQARSGGYSFDTIGP